jgi:hypothetical protein
MIYFPAKDITDRMRSEVAGVWVDRSDTQRGWLVGKLPTNLVREIVAGASLSLKAWVVQIDEKLVQCFGITIHEDVAAPRTFFGSCRSDAEAADLRTLLSEGALPIQLHNENSLPLLYLEGLIDPTLARGVLDQCPSVGYPEDQGFSIRSRANDVVEAVLFGTADPRVIAFCDCPLRLFRRRQSAFFSPASARST